MNLPFYIARRYLFSKKSHNAINLVSMVSVCGIAVATMALVCALSVYNGFSELVASMFSHFDPELKITPREGKAFTPDSARFERVRNLPGVAYYGETLEENALITYNDRQAVAILKGVDERYKDVTAIDSILIDGSFRLQDEVANYANLGIGLAYTLGINAGFVTPMRIYVPKRDARVNMANPIASFNLEYAFIGSVFRVDQAAYDERYMLIALPLARRLLGYDREVTAIELKTREGADLATVKAQIEEILGPAFLVRDRYEQQADSFRMMQVEKWMTFLILTFILAIALFNVVGSLSMLMIEKRDDAATLRHLGASEGLIRRVFLFEGWLICGLGALVGIALGVGLCLLQERFGLLRMGSSAAAFVIEAYPVRLEAADVLLVLLTVLVIGLLAAWYPVRYLARTLWAREEA